MKEMKTHEIKQCADDVEEEEEEEEALNPFFLCENTNMRIKTVV